VFSTRLKLRIQSDTDEIFYYPDLMVACRRDTGPEATAEFRSIGLSVPLAQIYAGTL
jgi:hypothetical protein